MDDNTIKFTEAEITVACEKLGIIHPRSLEADKFAATPGTNATKFDSKDTTQWRAIQRSPFKHANDVAKTWQREKPTWTFACKIYLVLSPCWGNTVYKKSSTLKTFRGSPRKDTLVATAADAPVPATPVKAAGGVTALQPSPSPGDTGAGDYEPFSNSTAVDDADAAMDYGQLDGWLADIAEDSAFTGPVAE